jgi:hypothetical protein
MLGLMIHAQVVAIVHHHSLTTPSASTFTADASGQSHRGPESSSDWQCQLCQLQRAFSSSAPAPAFIVEVIATPIVGQAYLAVPHTRGPTRALSDRAPPLA